MLEKPELLEGLVYLWEGFWTLSNSRPSGWGASAIPFTDMLAYARWKKWSKYDTQEAIEIWRSMDREFMKEQNAAAERNRKK